MKPTITWEWISKFRLKLLEKIFGIADATDYRRRLRMGEKVPIEILFVMQSEYIDGEGWRHLGRTHYRSLDLCDDCVESLGKWYLEGEDHE